MELITNGDTLVISFNASVSLMVGIIFLFVGLAINKKVAIFRKYCIPAPITGGLVFCIAHLILHQAGILEFKFDSTLQSFFMTLFFAAIGFEAGLGVIKKAGKLIVIFLLTTVVLTVFQNLIAVGISSAMGIHPLLGLMAGSPSLVGGHGNAAAFGMIAEEWGYSGAVAIGLAASTYGIIAGVLFGNPAAELLIKRHRIPAVTADMKGIELDEKPKETKFDPKALQNAFLIIIMALGCAYLVEWLWKQIVPGVTIVSHVWAMVMGVVFRLVCDARKIKLPEVEIKTLGNTFLALFVTMAVCTMQLWQLASLALPVAAILLANTVFTFLFVIFITFRLCGRNFDAACLASGQYGFGMGAVQASIANLDELSKKYAMSKVAYVVVPIVASLFSNFTNAIIINVFMSILH